MNNLRDFVSGVFNVTRHDHPRSIDPRTIRCHTNVAAQPQLGLWTQRCPRNNSDRSVDPDAFGPTLEDHEATPPHRWE